MGLESLVQGWVLSKVTQRHLRAADPEFAFILRGPAVHSKGDTEKWRSNVWLGPVPFAKLRACADCGFGRTVDVEDALRLRPVTHRTGIGDLAPNDYSGECWVRVRGEGREESRGNVGVGDVHF